MIRALAGIFLGQVVFFIAWFAPAVDEILAASLAAAGFLAFHLFCTGLLAVLRESR